MRNFLAASLLATEAFLAASNLSCLLLSNKSIFYLLVLMIQLSCCKDYANERNVSLLLKDARNYWKMFEGKGDKNKKGVSSLARCMGKRRYTL